MKKLFGRGLLVLALLATAMSFGASTEVSASTNCDFQADGNVTVLQGDCTTSTTIVLAQGFTLDGNGKTITVVDPDGGSFTGAVIQNKPGATEIHVRDLTIKSGGLGSTCPKDGLYGIALFNASGSIVNTTIDGIHRLDGQHGCQSVRAIYVENASDAASPYEVTISNNTIKNYQKAGIDVRGNTSVTITGNVVEASVAQHTLAANSIELVNGPSGMIIGNHVTGNQFLRIGDPDQGTAILLFNASNVDVRDNIIIGNSDVAIAIYGGEHSSSNTVINNKATDDATIEDGPNIDVGIWDSGINSTIYGNTATSFDIPIINSFNKLCYTLWTGALYQSNACSDWQDELTLTTMIETVSDEDASKVIDYDIDFESFSFCARNGSGEARWVPGPNPSCETLWNWWDEEEMSYPNTSLISICVNDDTGRVRVVDVGTSCQLDEWAGQI